MKNKPQMEMVMHNNVHTADMLIREETPQLNAAAWTTIHSTAAHMVRPITPPSAVHRCPNCSSIVYSRRHRLCGVCSQPLPEEFLFPVQESRRIKQLLEMERQNHRRWLAANEWVA